MILEGPLHIRTCALANGSKCSSSGLLFDGLDVADVGGRNNKSHMWPMRMVCLQMFQVMLRRRMWFSWQTFPDKILPSQSGPKSGHHSSNLHMHTMCDHKILSFDNMYVAVVDARVAALPIRVAGASAKTDGTQETQWSIYSLELGL